VVQNRVFSGDHRFHAGQGNGAAQTAARGADRRQAMYSPPKRAILATDYRQRLRIGPITPRVRIGIKDPCVGGSIPAQASSIDVPLFFENEAFS